MTARLDTSTIRVRCAGCGEYFPMSASTRDWICIDFDRGQPTAQTLDFHSSACLEATVKRGATVDGHMLHRCDGLTEH